MQDSQSCAKLSSLMFYQIFTAGALTLTTGGLPELSSYKRQYNLLSVNDKSKIRSIYQTIHKHISDKQTIL